MFHSSIALNMVNPLTRQYHADCTCGKAEETILLTAGNVGILPFIPTLSSYQRKDK